jgi:hypothetical protein
MSVMPAMWETMGRRTTVQGSSDKRLQLCLKGKGQKAGGLTQEPNHKNKEIRKSGLFTGVKEWRGWEKELT